MLRSPIPVHRHPPPGRQYPAGRVGNYAVPGGVSVIEDLAFDGAGYLTNVTVPGSVSYIGTSPWGDCTNLANITVDPANPYFSSVNGVLFDKAQTHLLQFPAGRGGNYAVPGGVAGYIVDQSCSKKGKGMWNNAECVARCVRDGDKIVLVTEDGKIFQISNQDKVTPDSFGQVVTLIGKMDGDTITVETVKM